VPVIKKIRSTNLIELIYPFGSGVVLILIWLVNSLSNNNNNSTWENVTANTIIRSWNRVNRNNLDSTSEERELETEIVNLITNH
jgi:hypothetical protein